MALAFKVEKYLITLHLVANLYKIRQFASYVIEDDV